MKVILVLFLAISQITSATARRPPPESERLEEYAKRNYTWPPTYVPNTPGWKALMESRFQQVAEIEDPASRFSGYVQTLYSATVMPNFTEHGFGLGRIPDDLLQEMQKNIREGLDEKECEGSSNTVVGDYPWIIWRPELMDRVAQHCHGYMEEWTGLDLELTSAYGLRLFRNDSHMRMHIDKKGIF